MIKMLTSIKYLILLLSCFIASVNATPPISRWEYCDRKPHMGQIISQKQPGWEIEFHGSGSKIDPSSMFFPIYGYWCGPGYSMGNTDPVPFDSLDNICKTHDQCYEREGYSNCKCDFELVRSVREVRKKKKDTVRCFRNGKWAKEYNPYYFLVENYFVEDMKKRSCSIPNIN